MSGVLEDRVVVVTGAGQGIGRAHALRIAAAGATVLVAERDEARGEAVAKEVVAAGGRAEARRVDVADPDDVEAAAARWIEEYGRIDGLVNNAALFSSITMRPFWEIPRSEWDDVLAVNVRGPWTVTAALLPGLRASGSASVVNIGSDAVWLGRPGYLHYVASKAGVAGMTHSMAHELGGDGIRVNTVSPGPVYTEIERATVTPEQKAAMRAAQALPRDAGPEDITGPVVFLLSADAGFVTGQTLHVDGGLVHR